MKKKKIKIIVSGFVLFSIILMIVLCVGLLVIMYTSPSFYEQNVPIILQVIAIFCMGVCPIFGIILTAKRWLAIIEISEKGIKRSILGFLFKYEIRWEEIKEIKLYNRAGLWIIISKTSELSSMSYEAAIKNKDIIQMSYSKKVMEFIEEFYNGAIIGLPTSI